MLDHPLNAANFQVQNLLRRGEEDTTTNVTISVIFYYTKEFEAVTPDIRGYVEGLVENTNIAFLRSGIPLRLAIHCLLQAQIGEAPESSDRIREFKQSRGEQNHKLDLYSTLYFRSPTNIYWYQTELKIFQHIIVICSLVLLILTSTSYTHYSSICMLILQAVNRSYFSQQISLSS